MSNQRHRDDPREPCDRARLRLHQVVRVVRDVPAQGVTKGMMVWQGESRATFRRELERQGLRRA
jgi:hypothetical protein